MTIEFDVSDVLDSLNGLEDVLSPEQMQQVLIECGNALEGPIVDKIVDNGTVDTGHLMSSIKTHVAESEGEEPAVTVGVHQDSEAIDYAVYVEYGTGIYAENGNGRKTPWWWKGTGKKWGAGQDKSAWHFTHGMQPHPYIRPALEENQDRCENIVAKRIQQAMDGTL